MPRGHNTLRGIALSLMLCFSMPTGVLAAQPAVTGTGTSQEDPKITVSVSETPSGDGTTTVTETTETLWADKDEESGFGTSFLQTVSTTTVRNSRGDAVSQSGFTQGQKTSTCEEAPPVTLTLIQDGEASAASDLKGSVTGGPASDDPCQYDQTTTTVERQRTVTVTAGRAEADASPGAAESGSGSELTPIQPVWTGGEKDVSAPRPDRFGQDDVQGPNGYHFRYTGWGQDSFYGAYHITTDTETVIQEADIIQFLLTDTANLDGPDHTAYCADLCTGVVEGWWYKIDNLEAAGYYPDETAQDHIRAIVNHGYWGTADGQPGSLSVLRELLTTAQTEGSADVQALLAGLDFTQFTHGEAQAATQIAIWQYGHRHDDDAGLVLTASNFNGTYGWTADEEDRAAWARIDAAAAYLARLTEGAGDTTQVLTGEGFIKEMTLTVKEKAKDDGAYYADLAFTLTVPPGERDSLKVQILQDGERLADMALLPGQSAYTLEGLALSEGKDIAFSLQLTGAQYLERGVYIYTSEIQQETHSQTFVGIAEGCRPVDIAMGMALRLNVEDAVITTEHIWRSAWSKDIEPEPQPTSPRPTSDPTPTPDPNPNPTPEPDPEPTPEPVPEPTPGPVPEPTPGPVPEPTPEIEVPKTDDSSLWLVPLALISGVLCFLIFKRRGNLPQ